MEKYNPSTLLRFAEWVKVNPSIRHEDRPLKYDMYLKATLVEEVIIADGEALNFLSKQYTDYLNRITLLYSEDDEVIKLSNIDLTDKSELINVIPILATKIRDIALFYNIKRKEISDVKVSVSAKGSTIGFLHNVESVFLTKYSKSGSYQDPTVDDDRILRGVVERESVLDEMDIQIVNLTDIDAQTPIL